MDRLHRIGSRLIGAIGVVIFLFLTFYSWCYSKVLAPKEYISTIRDNPFRHLLVLAGVLAVVVLLRRVCEHLSKKVMNIVAIILSVLAAVLLVGVIQNNSFYLKADQHYVYYGAVQMMEGNFDIDQLYSYFRVYPYQLGLAKIYTFFFWITGQNSYSILQGVNALCVAVTIYIGYRITGELFKTRLSECIYLLAAISFLPMYLYSFFIYGESMGVCGAMVAVYFFLKYNEEDIPYRKLVLYWLAAAGAMAFVYIVRGALIIVWIAMFGIQILLCLKNKGAKRTSFQKLFLTLLIPILALGSSAFLKHQVERSEQTTLNQGMPSLLCMTMGLQDHPDPGKAQGSYNDYDWVLYQQCNLDAELATAEAKAYLTERFAQWKQNPGEAITFFKEKLLNQWIEPTFNAFIMTDTFENPPKWQVELYKGKANQIWYGFLNEYQAVAYLVLLIYFVGVLGKKEVPKPQMILLGLILIGDFMFSAIWEAKGRYIYPFAVLGIPLIAGNLGVYGERLLKWIEDYLIQRKRTDGTDA